MRHVGVTDARGANLVSRRTALHGLAGFMGAAAMATSGLAACSSRPAAPRTAPDPGPSSAASSPGTGAVAIGDVSSAARAVTGFAGNWYRVGAGIGANWTASPLSVVLAFAMLRAGARGTSAQALDAAFGFGISSDPAGGAHPALHQLYTQILSGGTRAAGAPPSAVVTIANGLFVEQGFAVQPEFTQLLAADYGARAQSVDFTNPSSAAAAINAWVAAHTGNRIKKLFDSLDPSTVLVLADAVYLKATWQSQFEKNQTATAPFTTARGVKVDAPLMHQTFQELNYGSGPGWQRVTLPYYGELTMRVVVPTSVATTAAALRPAFAAAVGDTKDDSSQIVELTMPKWSTATSIDLLGQLSALGLGALFGSDADLSGIAREKLFVGQAVHRANITVDENGTEAAAVTGIAILSEGRVGPTQHVVADRPFAWAIVHEPTGTPVFAGHVVDASR
jgi:serpin B